MASTSKLHTKINSYALDRGAEFSEAYSLTPTRTGTATTTTCVLNGTFTYSSSVGPNGGAGSWLAGGATARFDLGSDGNYIQDGDYTAGVWFMIPTLQTGTGSYTILDLRPNATSTQPGFAVAYGGTTHATGASKIQLYVNTSPGTTAANITGSTLTAGQWNYVAVRRTTSNVYELFLNGTSVGTYTSGTMTSVAQTAARIGHNTTAAIAYYSNYHAAPSSVLTSTQISEIWTSGSTGYQSAQAAIGTPYTYFKLDENTGTTLTNSGSSAVNASLTNAVTWGDGKVRTALTMGTYGGYNTSVAMDMSGVAHSFSFWFKKNGAPASNTQWTYWYYNSLSNAGSPSEAWIGTDGKINYLPKINGTQGSALTSSSSICDNAWHHIVITRNGSTAKIYVDGTLNNTVTNWASTGTGGPVNNGTFGASNASWDEFAQWAIELSAANVTSLYDSTINPVTAIDLNYTAATMDITTSSLPMPVIDAIKNVNYTDTAQTASVDIVNPILSVEINADAGGVSTATTLMVDPSIYVEKQVNYSQTVMTASSLFTTAVPTISGAAAIYPSPLTASALLSASYYAGESGEDTAYTLSIRQVSLTNNVTGANGFTIGTQTSSNGSVIEARQSLLVKPLTGYPAYNKIIKSKFNHAHISVYTGGDVSPTNTYNIYVLTNGPTSGTFDTATYSAFTTNREYLYTTRLGDDGTNFWIDLTPAFVDARAHTNGVMIEHVVTTTGSSGSVWDRLEFSGSGLDNGKLLYTLSTDIIFRNVNAGIMTATTTSVTPTVATQKYVNLTADPATVSGTMVNPSVTTEKAINPSAATSTASALQTMPTFSRTTNNTVDHVEAFGSLPMPTITVIVVLNKIVNASPMTVSALVEMPGATVSGNANVTHFDASATFVMPRFTLDDGYWVHNEFMTASAVMVQPLAEGQLLGVVTAAPMIAQRADIVTPPAYVNLARDKWWSRLYAQHGIRHGERWKTDNLAGSGTSSAYAFFKLFNDVSVDQTWPTNNVAPAIANQAIWAMVQDYPPEASTDAYKVTYATMYQPTYTKVAPVLKTGTFDPYGRKAVKFQNVQYSVPENAYTADRPYSLEFSIKTTKSNQILATGNWYSWLYYGSLVGSIGLKDGKLFGGVWNSASKTPFPGYADDSLRTEVLYGRQRIDDGQWHHVIVQWGFDDRVQYWIDGQLDIQTIGGAGPKMRPYKFGYNSDDVKLYSDFETSAWSYDAAMFVGYRDIVLNSYSYIDYDPIKPEPFYASLEATQNNTAKGNRGRALMLYWWPTIFGQNGYGGVGYTGVPWQFPRGGHTYDQGVGGLWDYDTGFAFSTWDFKQDGPQRWYDWDIFPVDISGRYVSEVVKPAAYGGEKNIREVTYAGDDTYPISVPDWRKGKENIRGTFRDPITDAPRYLDVLNDIDLSQFDMIMFRNFPNQSREQDSYSKSEIYDQYFGGQERELYEKFLKGLRAAVDTGISLYINDYQLAIDFGIIDRVEPVPLLIDNQGTLTSDTHAPTVVPTDAADLPTPAGTYFLWEDTFYNNKHRIVSSFEGITDTKKIAYKADYAHHMNDGLRKFEGTDRSFDAVVHRPNGLFVGDEMLIPGLKNSKSLSRGSFWQGVPLSAVKAGTVISTFSQNYWRNNESVVNPYKDYATFIAVKPGDSVNGRQIGGKVIVSLVEHPMDVDNYSNVDLNTDYWINLAYNEGLIGINKKNALLSNARNLNRQLENGTISQARFERDSYWTHNDMYIESGFKTIRPNEQFPGDQYIGGGTAKEQNAPATNQAMKSLLASFLQMAGWSNAPWFMPTFSYGMDTVTVFTPTLTHLGIVWLSDRTFVTGLKVPQEVSAKSEATMIHPTITVQKFKVTNAQAMLGNAKITETGVKGPNIINTVLPFEAYGLMTTPVTVVKAGPMESAATLKTNVTIFTSSSDEVILYVNHVDPILYLREEVIK